MVKLIYSGVGEQEDAFPVDIEESESVGDLIKTIAEQEKFDFSPRKLHLFLCKKGPAWLNRVDAAAVSPDNLTTDFQRMDPLLCINNERYFGDKFSSNEGEVHVLVLVPEVSSAKKREFSRADLPTLDPKIQEKLWRSVVRISSADVFSATALVVDLTSTHYYLLTNLHIWSDLRDELSSEFQVEFKRYDNIERSSKKESSNEDAASASVLPRRSGRKRKNAPAVLSDQSKIVIEQYVPETGTLQAVHDFRLDSEVCWRCSAYNDFAIFEVPTPEEGKLDTLDPCGISFLSPYPTMRVHIFGFPAVLQDHHLAHPYAIIPAEVTDAAWNQMTLSALSGPGLSGLSCSAIVCTVGGIPLGYTGGGFDSSLDKEEHQSYGFSLQALPHDLPSALHP